jgi:hypothetical protein
MCRMTVLYPTGYDVIEVKEVFIGLKSGFLFQRKEGGIPAFRRANT